MQLYPQQYYHLYNRSNNDELIFKSPENYLYFLNRYRRYLEPLVDTIAYCLMPTHFHFIIRIHASDCETIPQKIGVWLNAYTKAINKRYQRHGSLFQQHTKAKLISDESYLLTLITYIHQNPIRSELVDKMENWQYSSYPDYIGTRNGTLPQRDFVQTRFSTSEEFIEFSNRPIPGIKKEYWV